MFGISAEKLIKKLREDIFETILKQEIGFFDHPKNNTGSLCSKMAQQTCDVQGVITLN